MVGETVESITAFAAVRDYAKKAVTNQLNVKNILVSAGPAAYGGTGGGGDLSNHHTGADGGVCAGRYSVVCRIGGQVVRESDGGGGNGGQNGLKKK